MSVADAAPLTLWSQSPDDYSAWPLQSLAVPTVFPLYPLA